MLGTWSIMASPIVADVIAGTGVDFIIIDAEHGPTTFETAQQMAIACESAGVSPMMRVPGIDEADILKALDIGCHGVQVPNVKHVEDIARIVQYAKYPPLGARGFSPFTRAGRYSHESSPQYTVEANNNTLVAIHLEGKDAIDQVASIAGVEGLDIIFVGLFDLSKSLGVPGHVEHPQVMSLLESVVQHARKQGKFVGTIATSPAQLRRFLDMGVQYITYSVDCEMLSRSYREATRQFQTKGVHHEI